jgi:hypothetical protein
MVQTIDPTDPALDGPIILPEEPANGFLLEHEIKDCWRHNMLAAADAAKVLAIVPFTGPTFVRLREALKLAEGACRQMCHWREDARWLYLAPMLEHVHQQAAWMLRHRDARKMLNTLEAALRKLVFDAELLENKATGKVGPILPKPLRLDRTEGRPMQVLNPDVPHSETGEAKAA